ncbi:hypothetical protein HDK77DRAFT_297316 [Phyllosticta capitalensis]
MTWNSPSVVSKGRRRGIMDRHQIVTFLMLLATARGELVAQQHSRAPATQSSGVAAGSPTGTATRRKVPILGKGGQVLATIFLGRQDKCANKAWHMAQRESESGSLDRVFDVVEFFHAAPAT